MRSKVARVDFPQQTTLVTACREFISCLQWVWASSLFDTSTHSAALSTHSAALSISSKNKKGTRNCCPKIPVVYSYILLYKRAKRSNGQYENKNVMLSSKLDSPCRQPSRRFELSKPPNIAAGISELLQTICEWMSLDSLRVNQQHSAPRPRLAAPQPLPSHPIP